MTSKTQVPDQMTTKRRRRDPSSYTVVRMPECDLAEAVLELAAPLFQRLGPDAPIDDARAAVALAVTFWNASVLASKLWEYPRVKELKDLRKRMRERQAVPGDAAMFDVLTELRRKHWLDPRLVESWSYDAGDADWTGVYLCPYADCDCHRVRVAFFSDDAKPESGDTVGSVLLGLGGVEGVEIVEVAAECGAPDHVIRELWTLFERRHDVGAFLRRREAQAKAVGATLWQPVAKPVRAAQQPLRIGA